MDGRRPESAEIKTPDRKTAERIEEYYLSKMLPDSVQIKAPSLYPADYFSPSTTMTPVISMSSLMEIRTKYALRRIDIVPYKIRSGWFSISNGQAQNWSPYPDGHLDARTLSFPCHGNDRPPAPYGTPSRTTVPFFKPTSRFPKRICSGKFSFPTPPSANLGIYA